VPPSTDPARRAVVTGLGAVMPIGNDFETYWRNLRDGVTGTRRIRSFDPTGFEVQIAAEVLDFDPTVAMDAKMARRMSRFIHFATAAKGPLVRGHRELTALAAATGAGFRFSAATGAGLPTVDTVEFALAGGRVERIEAVLNGTSNFVLDRMAAGAALDAALAEARALGIADGDGRQDVSGADTAAKLVAIANAVWDRDLSLEDVALTGIEDLEPAALRGWAAAGGAHRLLASASATGPAVVRPERLDAGHALAGVRGAEKAITFHTDTMGTLTLTGGRSDPRAAGAALLRDVLLLLRVGGRA